MSKFPRITSRPCPVFFAGFESTTTRLQAEGWDLSMEQLPMHHMDASEIRLAMRHEKAGLYAFSAPVRWDRRQEYGYQTMYSERRGFQAAMEALDYPLVFEIIWMGNNARFQIFPMRRAMSFSPIDAFTQVEQIEELSFEDAIPFRTIAPEAPEIVVDPASVAELMDLVLKAQDPKRAEIRQKARREAWRDREARTEGYDARKDIRAQIVSLAV